MEVDRGRRIDSIFQASQIIVEFWKRRGRVTVRVDWFINVRKSGDAG
jgi:hypothetical protein